MTKEQIRRELTTYYISEAIDEEYDVNAYHYTGKIENINGETYNICMSSSWGFELYRNNECVVKCHDIYDFMKEVEIILLRL